MTSPGRGVNRTGRGVNRTGRGVNRTGRGVNRTALYKLCSNFLHQENFANNEYETYL
jgi:hypothetical protein